MTSVLTVVGARPQFIKAAVVSRRLKSRGVSEILVHTGQHYDENMSQVFFTELGIPTPSVHLGIGSGAHGEQTGRMLASLESEILRASPSVVLIYGDTNSTLAGALAAAKLDVPVAHVEAGLRSYNRRMPEEINRVVADHLATVLFAPTANAVTNLLSEGIASQKIVRTGDVMYDLALETADKAASRAQLFEALALTRGGYVLATVHRAENTDSPQRLQNIMKALETLARDITVVLPLHPRTRERLGLGGARAAERVNGLKIIDPVGYLDMVALEAAAMLVMTDSGGVQKEAYFHRVPCVTMRHETEWGELIEAGWNRLAPPDSSEAVVAAARAAMLDRPVWQPALYGDGTTAEAIVTELAHRF